MKAITLDYDYQERLVEGKIVNGEFVVTSVSSHKETPDVDYSKIKESCKMVKGDNGFNGVAFQSKESEGDRYFAYFYIIEDDEIEMKEAESTSDVFVNAYHEGSSNNMPADKSDESNDLIFGEGNW